MSFQPDMVVGAWAVTLGVLLAEIAGANHAIIALLTLAAVVVAELLLGSILDDGTEVNGEDSL